MMRNYRSIYIAFAFLLFCSGRAAGQNDRPTLGYALSGGGAKGIAEIGVLKVLEEAGIRPDYIAGTSIGSIVGGLYATGYSAKELEELARATDWFSYFNDDLLRTWLPIEERMVSERYQLSVFWGDKGIELPRGFVVGQKMGIMLAGLTYRAHNIDQFDDYHTPFRAVAADLETGKAVVFDRGLLVDAIRASMSIPSIFAPVELDGRLLVDGGVVRNLPVEDARAMGADYVLAIDVGGPLFTKDEINSLLNVLDQTNSFRMAESNEKQAANADFIIRPDIKDYSVLSFDKIDTLIALGEAAARESLPKIKAKLENWGWTPPPSKERLAAIEEFKINNIAINGVNSKVRTNILNLLRIQKNQTYQRREIELELLRLLGSEVVTKVDYRLVPEDDGYQLVLRSVAGDSDYIKVSVNYDSDIKAGLLLNVTLRNQLLPADKFTLDLKAAEFPMLLGHYRFYLAARPALGFRIEGKFHRYPGLFYDKGRLNTEFRLNHFELNSEFFTRLGFNSYLSLGIGAERYEQNNRFFNPSTQELELSQGNVYLRFLRDTYNRKNFPTEGSSISLNGKLSFYSKLKKRIQDVGASSQRFNSLTRLEYGTAFPVTNKFSIDWRTQAGLATFTEGNLINLFFLGRALPEEPTHVAFTGLRYMERPATAYATSGLKMQFEPWSGKFVSFLMNYGYYDVHNLRISDGASGIAIPEEQGDLLGAGVELGILSRIGPARFTTEYNFLDDRLVFYLHLGYVF